MVFKGFDTMLLGAVIRIHTDHNNLMYTTSVNDRVLRQLNYIEQFGPTYQHIAGDETFLPTCLVNYIKLTKRLPCC
jgi:hypothetical protein